MIIVCTVGRIRSRYALINLKEIGNAIYVITDMVPSSDETGWEKGA